MLLGRCILVVFNIDIFAANEIFIGVYNIVWGDSLLYRTK
jgi:hypothetical protein